MLTFLKNLSIHTKFALIFTVGIGMYLSLMEGFNVWPDEIFSLLLLNMSWPDMIKTIMVEDGHPPLFYILLRLWMAGTNYHDVFVARLFPFSWVIATAVLGIFPVKRLFGKTTGLLFSFLTFFMPYGFFLATDIRMYSMGNFFVIATLLYSFLCLKENKTSDWIKFFIFGILGMYTHYYVTMAIGIIYGILFLRLIIKHRKWTTSLTRFFICGIATAILFLPWLIILTQQTKNMYTDWFPELAHIKSAFAFIFFTPLQDIKNIYSETNNIFIFFFSACWSLILIFLTGLLYKKTTPNDKNILFTLLTCALIVMFALLISYFLRPIFVWRYVMAFFPGCFCLTLAFIAAHQKEKLPILLVSAGVLCSMSYYMRSITLFDNFRRQSVQMIQQNATPDTLILTTNSNIYLTSKFYFPSYKHLYVPLKKELIILRQNISDDRQNNLPDLNNAPLYLFIEDQRCTPSYTDRYYLNKKYCLQPITPIDGNRLWEYSLQFQTK